MNYIKIEVPQMNDSISRVSLDKRQYFLRFTYRDTGDYWVLGIYDSLQNIIVSGIKIVPQFPVNLFIGNPDLPDGIFGVLTKQDRVGHKDFWDDTASFVFIPTEGNEV